MKASALIKELREIATYGRAQSSYTSHVCRQAAATMQRFFALADELEDDAQADAALGTPRAHAYARRSRKIAKRIREIAENER